MTTITRNSRPAAVGGKPVRDVTSRPWPSWPVWDEGEREALLEVLEGGQWSYNGPMEQRFNTEFGDFVGVRHVISAANGTVTLQLALEACGIGIGDEVIVPGLTWQATAAAVVDVNAVPVLVDVAEDTWCMDPEAVREAITSRTKAIIPVHLYGSFVDMDLVMAIAREHDLKVIEDCAHKHGGEWRGRRAGSFGDIGSFSFQLSKLMSAGEGGALTTSDDALYERLDALRNCGRRPENAELADRGAGQYGDEGNFIQSGNYRITDFQAAVLLQQLRRLPDQNLHRDENAIYLNGLLNDIPGVSPMRRDERETREAYFNFAFRFHSDDFKGLSVARFREALAAELGCSVDPCYEPLNDCSLYTPHTKPWRHSLSADYWRQIDPKRFDLPNCRKAHDEESVCMHFKVLMGPRTDMDEIAGAVQKLYDQADDLL